MARYVGVAQVIAGIKQLCRMIDCFVLAGVKTFSQRDTLSTREMAASSVPSLLLYLSYTFSGILQPTDARIAHSRLRVFHTFNDALRQNPSCLQLSRLSLLILFNYLHVYVIHDYVHTCRFIRRSFLPNTFHILSIYYLFRREKSRHVENHIA